MSLTKMECPWCKGKGKLNSKADYEYEIPKRTEHFTVSCSLCNGTGTVTQKQIDHQKHLESLWCKCEKPLRRGEKIDYDVKTNCWTCGRCGKVYQTG